MKAIRFKGALIFSLIIALCISGNSYAKEVSREKAIQIAKSIANNRFPANWANNKANISIHTYLKSDYPFYVCDVDRGGFVLVSRDDRCPPVLGFSFEGSFSTELSNAPASLKSYFEDLKTACGAYIRGEASYPLVGELWDKLSLK